jgi:zinc/manganese transport system substrate-binding protein
MKKIILLTILLTLPITAFAKLNVVTTTSDLAAIARAVGGENINVKNLIKGTQDPHYMEPKPSYIVLMNRADLFVQVGLELEVGWVPPLLTQSRNPHIQEGKPGFMDASFGIKLLEVPQGKVNRAEGDIHPLGNPHYWLNPENGLIVAHNIAGRLAALDPGHAPDYKKNLAAFEALMKKKIGTWKRKLAGLKGLEFITYHTSFTYFSDWSGLRIVGTMEPKPGIPPNPSHLMKLVNLIKSRKIPFVISEVYYNPRPSKKLAKQTGVKILRLPVSVGGVASVKTYDGLFDYTISQIGITE